MHCVVHLVFQKAFQGCIGRYQPQRNKRRKQKNTPKITKNNKKTCENHIFFICFPHFGCVLFFLLFLCGWQHQTQFWSFKKLSKAFQRPLKAFKYYIVWKKSTFEKSTPKILQKLILKPSKKLPKLCEKRSKNVPKNLPKIHRKSKNHLPEKIRIPKIQSQIRMFFSMQYCNCLQRFHLEAHGGCFEKV